MSLDVEKRPGRKFEVRTPMATKPFWGLSAIECAYGADRIVEAAILEGYDLIVITRLQ